MININKKYKTKKGQEVKLLLIDGDQVLGAFKNVGNYDGSEWLMWSWAVKNGQAMFNPCDLDLVEVVEPIETTIYCVQYDDGSIYVFESKTPYDAPSFAEKVLKKTITFTEDDLVKD